MINAVLLMGPTATGKTNLALQFAQEFPIEIISVDSALVYKGMDIGTAKPSKQEQAQVRHHLIDIITPLESYSVAQFIDDSVDLIYAINKRGKIPILVGGTMMYYNGLLKGISKLPLSDVKIRAMIDSEAANLGWPGLHQKLQQIDQISAAKIKSTDKQRISRALEVYYISGKPMSVLQSESNIQKSIGINFLPLAILPQNREILHNRIEERFSAMLDDGFIQEVQNLRNTYSTLSANHSSMRCVGYNQVWQYLEGLITMDDLKEKGVAATRQLAKRQITWLRGMEVINLDSDNLNYTTLYTNLLNEINKVLIRKYV